MGTNDNGILVELRKELEAVARLPKQPAKSLEEKVQTIREDIKCLQEYRSRLVQSKKFDDGDCVMYQFRYDAIARKIAKLEKQQDNETRD